MGKLDFSSWQGVLSTLLGLVIITLLGVGIRLLVMQTLQQRRERENRQINERLRTLIAAYKALGGSFTGNLAVDPTHLRDLRHRADPEPGPPPAKVERPGSDRTRRIRDTVEAALSDVVLLGTEDQVRLASRAASELVAGRPVHTAELVVSLRDFIRSVLDLDPISPDLLIPRQGPTRPGAARGGRAEAGEREGGKGGGRGPGGDPAGGLGAGMGAGMSMGVRGDVSDDESDHHDG